MTSAQLGMAMSYAQLLYLAGTSGNLDTVADILVWVLTVGCADDTVACSQATSEANTVLWQMRQVCKYPAFAIRRESSVCRALPSTHCAGSQLLWNPTQRCPHRQPRPLRSILVPNAPPNPSGY